MNHITRTGSISLLTAFLAVLISFPTVSLAAARPTCSLAVSTSQGEVDVRNSGEEVVLVEEGEEISIAWKSVHADEAFFDDDEIDTKGREEYVPEDTTTYVYRFENGNRSVECALTARVVAGDFDEDTLTTTASRTTIKGTAEGTDTVQLTISKKEGSKPLFTSKTLRVKNGKWASRITKTLAEGEYVVKLLGDKKAKLNVIATDTFTVGKERKDDTKKSSDTILVIENIPLLRGGKTGMNMNAPISYFQAINIGTSAGVVEDVRVKHAGTAPSSAIVGFTVTDDQSLTNVVYLPKDPAALFRDGVATIPIDAVIGARQMRLFTVRALLAPTAFAHYGKQFQLSVAGVDTNAKMRAQLPLPSVWWTIGF